MQAIERSSSSRQDDSDRISFNLIKSRMGDLIYKLSSQKFIEPSSGEESVKQELKDLYDDVQSAFRQMEDEYR